MIVKRELEMEELKLCQIESSRRKDDYEELANGQRVLRRKEALHRIQIIDDQCIHLNEEIQELQRQVQQLSRKRDHFKQLHEQEHQKWIQYIEQSVRKEVESNRDHMDTQVWNRKLHKVKMKEVQHLEETLQQLESSTQSQREELERLQMERILQQEDYNTLMIQWKKKQAEVGIEEEPNPSL